MIAVTSSFTAAELATVVLAVVLVILLSILGYRAWQRSRITPAERERRRCAWIMATGKMGDAALVEIHESVVFYSYGVRGVEYTASQDLGLLGRAHQSRDRQVAISQSPNLYPTATPYCGTQLLLNSWVKLWT